MIEFRPEFVYLVVQVRWGVNESITGAMLDSHEESREQVEPPAIHHSELWFLVSLYFVSYKFTIPPCPSNFTKQQLELQTQLKTKKPCFTSLQAKLET